jgi:SAM-dependent methyltransferase
MMWCSFCGISPIVVLVVTALTELLGAPAEDLPFDDGTFDVVVSTLVLCGVDDQPRTVREIQRVLRPGGRLLFLEHLRSDDGKVARTQDRLNWLNRLVVCCDCNRPTLDTIAAAGFDIAHVDHTALPKAPPFVRPAVIGTAVAPAGGNGSRKTEYRRGRRSVLAAGRSSV